MQSYSKLDVILVRYPFSDLTTTKIRPAVVVHTSHASQDLFIDPLTSKTGGLLLGEFALEEWLKAGLNIETAVKRGIYSARETLVSKRIGKLEGDDVSSLEQLLREWLGLS